MGATIPTVREGVQEVLPGSALAPGVYLVKLSQGGNAATARAVVL
jgi:hypothetical protein